MSYLCNRVCENKTEYGYCKTTYCIYPDFPHRAVGYTFTKPKTNADRIRAMSDDELATFIEEASCPPACYRTHIYECRKEDCAPCWLAWLQAEAKE